MRRAGAHHRRGEEGRLSAAGVLAGIRDADGVIGDLGGGSVELVRVAAVPAGAAYRRRDQPAARAAAPCRARRQPRADVETIERTVSPGAGTARGCRQVALLWSAAPGARSRACIWSRRTIRCTSSTNTRCRAAPAEGFLDIIAGQSRRSLERDHCDQSAAAGSGAAGGTDSAPADRGGAARADRVFGVRIARGLCLRPVARGAADVRSNLLIAASQSRWHQAAAPEPRWRSATGDGDLQQWIAPRFRGLSSDAKRLHRAVCWLSDIAWAEHPDYRAEHAFARSLTMPVAAARPCRTGVYRRRAARPLRRRRRRPGQGGDRTLLDEAVGRRGARPRPGAAARLHAVAAAPSNCSIRCELTREGEGLVLNLPRPEACSAARRCSAVSRRSAAPSASRPAPPADAPALPL